MFSDNLYANYLIQSSEFNYFSSTLIRNNNIIQMVKKLLLVFTLLIHVLSASSQCVEASEKKILLVGDSWAFFMNTDGTFNDVLEHWGFSNM